MRLFIISLIISKLISLNACHSGNVLPNTVPQPNPEANLSEAQKYFLKIALGSEFGANTRKINKWKSEIKLFLPDSSRTDLLDELKRILVELNNLNTELKIRRVMQENEANFVVFLSGKNSYGNYEPNVKNLLDNNWGLVWIYWNSQSEIYKGSMYVDIERNTDINCMKHLLREELTQGLGLLNDTNDYPSSIFYQQWTCSPSYADIDKEVIKLLYNPQIKIGMSKNEVIKVLESL
jgi:hypothetical protein